MMATISADNLIKAHAAIAILMGRRETWSLITYGDLGKRINHDPYLLTHILNAVGAWCQSRGKAVIGTDFGYRER